MLHHKIKTYLLSCLFCGFFLVNSNVLAADLYFIDTTGGHASVNFRIKHLGYSWLTGRFSKFKGNFVYDEKNPANSSIQMTVTTNSLNTDHALRDRHLPGGILLNTRKFPRASFKSTSYQPTGKTTGIVSGPLMIHGVTRNISARVKLVGAGKDPWDGYRRGYETEFKIRLTDYGIKHDLGDASNELILTIYIEGIKDTKPFTPD